MNSPTKELIRLYAKQLKTPTLSQYEEVERQLEATARYDVFLLELLKRELAERQSSSQKRRIKQAKFPVLKTMDEFDCNRCPKVEKAFLRQLATCDFVKSKSNLVLGGQSRCWNDTLVYCAGHGSLPDGIPCSLLFRGQAGQ